MAVPRVTTSTAAVVDEPSTAQLSALVAEVDRSGRGNFLIAQRHDAGRGDLYLQARRESVGWVLELRDGGPDRQYEATVGDTALVFAALASWVNRVKAWQGLPWRHVPLAALRTPGRTSGELARAV